MEENGKISKENEGEKGELCCTLKPSSVVCVVTCLSFDSCLVIFWPNAMIYKSCPPLTLTHTNVGTAVVEAAVSWEIARRLLGFHVSYATIQTS